MLNISLLLFVVVLTCLGTTLCPYSILMFKEISVVLLTFGFCTLWDAYLSWMLLNVTVGLSWTILLLSLCIQTEYNSSLLLEEELKTDRELIALDTKVQPFTSSFLSLLLKIILLATQLSTISMSLITRAMFKLELLKAEDLFLVFLIGTIIQDSGKRERKSEL